LGRKENSRQMCLVVCQLLWRSSIVDRVLIKTKRSNRAIALKMAPAHSE